ncbi:hypothetical protein [Prochlorococcus marinus]|uniref:hypothetical protein n=1 Tax=Prochlorococcus marinus TaxID=1219 RepID=UPI0022B41680|nr:hypothetical protein [Prochlorococcus marinus]
MVDLLLCLLIAFSIISFTSSLFIRVVDFGFVEVICFYENLMFEVFIPIKRIQFETESAFWADVNFFIAILDRCYKRMPKAKEPIHM